MAIAIRPLSPAFSAQARAAIEHEHLTVRRGEHSGVHIIVAVHSTVLGPALGGCRMWPYSRVEDAIDDALRLSRAMTLKAAAADLPLGGGKAVICLPPGLVPSAALRHEILRDLAAAIAMLDGRYITAEDVGTTSEDMAVLAGLCPHVVGRPARQGGSGDPSDYTAAGVEAAMRACCQHEFGTRELAGRRVAVIGCGSVGGHLARRLHAVHAELVLSDIDGSRRALASELDANWMSPEQALDAAVDIVAPCALGGMIDAPTAERLGCRIVCGAANNQLADDGVAELLATRGILYAPDFIVNAAGLINVYLELSGYDQGEAARRAAAIEDQLGGVFNHASEAGITPLQAAEQLAMRRLNAA